MLGVEQLAEHHLAEVLAAGERRARTQQRQAVAHHRAQQLDRRRGRAGEIAAPAQHHDRHHRHQCALGEAQHREPGRQLVEPLVGPPQEPDHRGLGDVEQDRQRAHPAEALESEQRGARGGGEAVGDDQRGQHRQQHRQLRHRELVRQPRRERGEQDRREHAERELDPERDQVRAAQGREPSVRQVLGGVALEEHLEVAGREGREAGERERERDDPVLGGTHPAQQQGEVQGARQQRDHLLDREVEHPARHRVRDLARLHAASAASASSSPSRNARTSGSPRTDAGIGRFDHSSAAISGWPGS